MLVKAFLNIGREKGAKFLYMELSEVIFSYFFLSIQYLLNKCFNFITRNFILRSFKGEFFVYFCLFQED